MTAYVETSSLVRRIRDDLATGLVPLSDVGQLLAAYLELREDMIVTRNVNSAYARENERLIGKRLAKLWAAEQRPRSARAVRFATLDELAPRVHEGDTP